MLGQDVWTWAAIALFLGPVLAGLSIPILRWLFGDVRRLLVFLLLLGMIFWKYHHDRLDPPKAAAFQSLRAPGLGLGVVILGRRPLALPG